MNTLHQNVNESNTVGGHVAIHNESRDEKYIESSKP